MTNKFLNFYYKFIHVEKNVFENNLSVFKVSQAFQK